MKDKSRFISSVIVSLLAGFIYYQFGSDINEKLQNSFRAVLSSTDTEDCCDSDFPVFNSLSNCSIGNEIKKSKFSLKKKRIRETIVSEVSITATVSEVQARNIRPTADKNVDFTAELEHLKKDDRSSVPSRQLKIETGRRKNMDGIADTKELKMRVNMLHKDFGNKTGNGFEYNVMNEGTGVPEIKAEPTESEVGYKTECTSEKSGVNKYKYYKVKIKCPKQNSNGYNKTGKPVEINIEDNTSDDDSM